MVIFTNIMAYIKCNLLLVIAVLTALMVYLCNYTTKTPVEPAKEPRQQKIYRWCKGECYILKSYTEQEIIREVSCEEVDRKEDILLYGYCHKDLIKF